MSKFCDGKRNTASTQSWRAPRDASDTENWPTSRWFQKYHANCKTEQWRSKETKEPVKQNTNLEQPSSSDVWKAIRKNEPSSSIELNNVMTIPYHIMKSPTSIDKSNRITSSYDVMHRIHELNGTYERDDRNWRLRVKKVVDKKCVS